MSNKKNHVAAYIPGGPGVLVGEDKCHGTHRSVLYTTMHEHGPLTKDYV